jgi:hypothetical protein
MSAQAGTIEIIAIELAGLLSPLENDLSPQRAQIFFARLGMVLTPAQVSSLAGPMGTIVTGVTGLLTIMQELDAAMEAGNYVTLTQKGLAAVAKIKDIINSFIPLGNSIGGMLPGIDGDGFRKRLFHYLLAFYLEKSKGMNEFLELLGILERDDKNFGSTDAYTIDTFHFDRISGWLSNPMNQLKSLYDWGGPSFDGKKFFTVLEKVLSRIGLPVLYDDAVNPVRLDLVVFEIVPDTSVSPKGMIVKVKSNLPVGTQTFQRNDFKIDLKAGFQTPTDTAIHIRSDGNILFVPLSASNKLAGDFMMTVTGQRDTPPAPYILFGQAGGSRFEIGALMAGAGVGLTWGGDKGSGTFKFEAALNKGKVVIDTRSGDGFLAKLLPGTNFEADFELTVGVSADRGLYFGGSSALEIRLPAHIDLGPASVEGVTLTAKLDGGKIPLSIGADIKAALGPIVAVVQNMGVTSTFSFPASGSGNLGPLQLDIGFKPPSGVGLSIDTGIIKGGGFLRLDADKGEYVGALELSFAGIIALKAIGVINTKMPDGSKGFALLILITAEFTPLQLGFGFTLNGVGGLLGLNRTTDLEGLRNGVRTGAVSSILFPQDVVANITRIISDLKAIFPVAQDHFLIAPMAKLGWGTPTLISLEMGIIIDIPVPRLVIIGVLRCIIPTEEAAILKLQVNFAGGIDFDQGLIWFDASLFDSSIMGYTLSGDMALRIGWKDPQLVISVGGFHPAFHEVPADLTGMRRIMLSLLSGKNPRLNAQIYFAITSNSVQSGALVELYAAACGFNVYGYLGYDLLVQFSPFHFIADIYAGLALRSGSSEIAGIHVHCLLSGPTPWHAEGNASLKILFFKVKVRFAVTWGNDAPAQPLEIADVLQLVKGALNDQRNWKAELPANASQGVTLRKIEWPVDKIIIHPFGMLSVSQKVVPLGITINKFGNRIPGADTLFNLSYAGGTMGELRDEFAIGNFIQLNDSEKLSRKSFEQMKSGLQLSPSSGIAYGAKIHKDVNYELSYVHKKKLLVYKYGNVAMFDGVFKTLAGGGAIQKNIHSVSKQKASLAPAKVTVGEGQYMVVNTGDLALYAPDMVAASEAEAYAMHDSLVSLQPSLKGSIQVVSAFELN